MKCIFLKLTAFAMLATASASGVYASSESDEPSSITPQSLRGSFLDENEDADWWGGGDMSTCTTNCQCSQGGCSMPKCRNNCQCAGGRCNMSGCTSNCQCSGGRCDFKSCRSNCQCWRRNCRKSDDEGDSEDVGFDQSSSDEDEEEYDSGDFEHDEDEELDEAVAFAQA